MDLYLIAEALSLVLEINGDGTGREASFHLTNSGTHINIDVHPDAEDMDHVYYFTSYPQFGEHEMEEARWSDDVVEPAVLQRKHFSSFEEMLAAVKEVGKREQTEVQVSRKRRLPRTTKTKA